jgi:hypothetical protein
MPKRAPESRTATRAARVGLACLSLLLAGVFAAAILRARRASSPRTAAASRPPNLESGAARPSNLQRSAARSTTPDLFTTIPHDTLPIAWREWSNETFAAARRARLGVVALLDAAWCESGVLYAAALAADPAAHAALETRVLPVRVDVDRRPDVHERYHVGFSGFPTLVFLTPEGALWDLTDAQPPGQLVRILGEMRADPRPRREDPGIAMLRASLPAPTEPRTASSPAPPGLDAASARLAALPARIWEALRAAWPATAEPLQPDSPLLEWDALGFLRAYAEGTGSVPARQLYLDTLRRMLASPLHHADGSFVRDVEPMPGRVSRAAFLATNAVLLEHLDTASRWTRDAAFSAAADSLAGWLRTVLWDDSRRLFRGAQGTLVLRDGRPVLTLAERERLENGAREARGTSAHPGLAPTPIEIFPTPGNARACVALGPRPEGAPEQARDRAAVVHVLDALCEPVHRTGHAAHDFASGPADVTAARGHPVTLRASACDFLADYAELGLALLAASRDGAGAAGRLQTARALGDTLLVRFAAPDGRFLYDVPAPGPGVPDRSRVRLAPLEENARAALFLLELSRATSRPRYREAALRVLETWSDGLDFGNPWRLAPYGIALLATGGVASPP